MKANKTIITALLTTLTIAPTFAEKVCAPHEMIVADLQDELSQVEDNSYSHKISSIRSKKSQRESEITSKERNLSSAQGIQGKLERRMHQLTHNMKKIKSDLSSSIVSEKRNISSKQHEVAKNDRKKSDCKSGLFGSFCRKKYRARAQKANDSIASSQRRIKSAQSKLTQLPKEKAALPGKVAQAKQTTHNAKIQLKDVLSMKPSVSQMQKQINRLTQKQQEVGQEVVQLEEQLVEAQEVQEQCVQTVKVAKAYPVLKKQIKVLKQDPELCDNIGVLLDLADKQFKRKAIKDAAKIVCVDDQMQMEQDEM